MISLIQRADVKVIGIWGLQGVGKTALANAIAAKCEGSEVLPLAEPLKRLAKEYFGWDGVKDARGRALLQHLGTDTGRAFDPEIWVRKWEQAAGAALFMGVKLILVDDVRFPNEVEAIRKMGGVIVKLVSTERGNVLDHASERLDLEYDMGVQAGPGDAPEDTAKTVLWMLTEVDRGER